MAPLRDLVNKLNFQVHLAPNVNRIANSPEYLLEP